MQYTGAECGKIHSKPRLAISIPNYGVRRGPKLLKNAPIADTATASRVTACATPSSSAQTGRGASVTLEIAAIMTHSILQRTARPQRRCGAPRKGFAAVSHVYIYTARRCFFLNRRSSGTKPVGARSSLPLPYFACSERSKLRRRPIMNYCGIRCHTTSPW